MAWKHAIKDRLSKTRAIIEKLGARTLMQRLYRIGQEPTNAEDNAFPRGMSNSQIHQSKNRPRTRTAPSRSLVSQVENNMFTNKAQISRGSMELRVMCPIRVLLSYMCPSIPSSLQYSWTENVKIVSQLRMSIACWDHWLCYVAIFVPWCGCRTAR